MNLNRDVDLTVYKMDQTMDKVYLEGRTTAMCVQTPDGENLKEALGYRADQVAGLSL